MPYKDKQKQSDYQNEWTKRRRLDWVTENGPCFICFSNENLEIHHVILEHKWLHRIWSYCKEIRDKELKKCIVLCYECHLKITNEQKKGKPKIHGTHSTYTTGCRCDLCRKAHAKYNREYKLRVLVR